MESVTIRADEKKYWPDYAEVWRYRDLVISLVKRNFSVSYKRTALGPLWIVLSPLLQSVAYMVFFGGIFSVDTGTVPQYLFYLLGTALWLVTSGSFSSNSDIFSSNSAIFDKVYFPRVIIPISNMLVNAVKFCVSFLITLVFLIPFALKGTVSPRYILWAFLPLVILWQGVLGMSLGMIFSSLITRYRDFSFLTRMINRAWMFATPVVYPLSQVSTKVLSVLISLNPASRAFELFRYIMVGEGKVSPVWIVYSVRVTAVLFIIGNIAFSLVEKDFIDRV